jgi:hypothetical protein
LTPKYMRNIAVLLPILAAVSPLGRATVVYSFATSTNSIHFQYTSPGFIASTTAVPAANLDSCVYSLGSCGEVDFNVSGSDAEISITNSPHLSFKLIPLRAWHFFDQPLLRQRHLQLWWNVDDLE